jgi:hypothetical protein
MKLTSGGGLTTGTGYDITIGNVAQSAAAAGSAGTYAGYCDGGVPCALPAVAGAPSGTGIVGVNDGGFVVAQGPDAILDGGGVVVQSATGYTLTNDMGGTGKFPTTAHEQTIGAGSTHPINGMTKAMLPATSQALTLIGVYTIPDAGTAVGTGGLGSVDLVVSCWDSTFTPGDGGLVDYLTQYYSFDYTVSPSGAIALNPGIVGTPGTSLGGDAGQGVYVTRASGGTNYDGGVGGGWLWFSQVIADAGAASSQIGVFASVRAGAACRAMLQDGQGGL